MDFIKVANERYATKRYDSTQKLSDEQVSELKEILHKSPSSINSQPWRFTFIGDQTLKEELADFSFNNAGKVRDCSHLVVFSVIDDVALFEEQIATYLPEGAVAYFNNNVKPGGEQQIKAWMAHQVYLALGFFLSNVASLGIDSTPMEGINPAEYDRILKIDGYKSLFAVALGYRSADDFNQPSVKPKSRIEIEKVIYTR